MLPPLELAAYCACGSPITLGMCGGGSETIADEVSVDSGMAEAGVEDSRSMYEMNDSRFVMFFGDGGCEDRGAGIVIDCCGGTRECRGCSVWVAVVGEDVFELESASDAAEK